MSSDTQEKIQQERKSFTSKAKTVISDMGDLLDPDQREKLARSIVKDYNPLPPEEAEIFIRDNPDLIKTGASKISDP